MDKRLKYILRKVLRAFMVRDSRIVKVIITKRGITVRYRK